MKQMIPTCWHTPCSPCSLSHVCVVIGLVTGAATRQRKPSYSALWLLLTKPSPRHVNTPFCLHVNYVNKPWIMCAIQSTYIHKSLMSVVSMQHACIGDAASFQSHRRCTSHWSHVVTPGVTFRKPSHPPAWASSQCGDWTQVWLIKLLMEVKPPLGTSGIAPTVFKEPSKEKLTFNYFGAFPCF